MARWLVETCLVEAVRLNGRADNLVCVNIQDLTFKHPVDNGEVVAIETSVKKLGRTSPNIGAYVYTGSCGTRSILETAITFVTIDLKGEPMLHHLNAGNLS
jgi:acyl-CoA hydrolase